MRVHPPRWNEERNQPDNGSSPNENIHHSLLFAAGGRYGDSCPKWRGRPRAPLGPLSAAPLMFQAGWDQILTSETIPNMSGPLNTCNGNNSWT